MRKISILTVAAVLLASCGPSTTPTTTGSPMAAALVSLVQHDNTFGGNGSPFATHLIVDQTDPSAGAEGSTADSRPLTTAERSSIEEAFAAIGEIQWISDASEWINDDLVPKLDGSVILSVGEPAVDGDVALVPIYLWCGGLCGTWFTYELHLIDGLWEVVGIVGPVVVS